MLHYTCTSPFHLEYPWLREILTLGGTWVCRSFTFSFERGENVSETRFAWNRKKFKRNRRTQKCAAQLRFHSRKCERKSFRLEPKKLSTKPAHPRQDMLFAFNFEFSSYVLRHLFVLTSDNVCQDKKNIVNVAWSTYVYKCIDNFSALL